MKVEQVVCEGVHSFLRCRQEAPPSLRKAAGKGLQLLTLAIFRKDKKLVMLCARGRGWVPINHLGLGCHLFFFIYFS